MLKLIEKTVQYSIVASDKVIKGANVVKANAPVVGATVAEKFSKAKREVKFAAMQGIHNARR